MPCIENSLFRLVQATGLLHDISLCGKEADAIQSLFICRQIRTESMCRFELFVDEEMGVVELAKWDKIPRSTS